VNKETIQKDLFGSTCINENLNWSYKDNVYSALEETHAAILITEWSLYKTINWEKILSKLKKPFWIFDTRLILKPKELNKLGIKIWQLGYGNNI